MPRTVAEIVADAEKLAKQFEEQEPGAGDLMDATPLRELRRAFEVAASAQQAVADAVSVARAQGHSWRTIGMMIGTSGEAARQRYGGEPSQSPK
jgi:hypothetical protein